MKSTDARFLLPGKEFRDLLKRGYAKLRQQLLGSEDVFELHFLNIKDHPLAITAECFNQVVVMYRNGKFEILPIKINGEHISTYLGVHYGRIEKWSLMPAATLVNNSTKINGYNTSDRDVYQCK